MVFGLAYNPVYYHGYVMFSAFPQLSVRYVSERILYLGEPNNTRALFSLGDWALLTKRPHSRQVLSPQPSNLLLHCIAPFAYTRHAEICDCQICKPPHISLCEIINNRMFGGMLANILSLFSRRDFVDVEESDLK